MNGGNGPYSYTQNSIFQKNLVDVAKELIDELINENLDIENPLFDCSNPLRIADLGCYVGPNTFLAVQNIIEAIEFNFSNTQKTTKKPQNSTRSSTTTLATISTLSSNPFPRRSRDPSVLTTLPVSPVPSTAGYSPNRWSKPHACSSALHWLSRIPNQLADRYSPAFNRGRISHIGTEEAVEAYSGQFSKDMEDFLNDRTLELVNPGMMIVLTFTLPDGVLYSETTLGMGYEIFGSCLVDMANTSVCRESEFVQLAFLFCVGGGVEGTDRGNGYFQVVRIPMGDEKNHNPRLCARHFRAVIEGVVEDHFGKEIVDKLFDRLSKKLEGNIFIFDKNNRQEAQFCVS
ncbi:loganic acid O-methyltransferase-like [Actinidia eriantha]|uniref:loganic acid O-methyltransferase-like n=1 Tax=Actinidia eriantha TaxID=165200 RepID=UPI00258759E8|nr:loganic acid O-methyltransferase-like [Actinidia eriantha]